MVKPLAAYGILCDSIHLILTVHETQAGMRHAFAGFGLPFACGSCCILCSCLYFAGTCLHVPICLQEVVFSPLVRPCLPQCSSLHALLVTPHVSCPTSSFPHPTWGVILLSLTALPSLSFSIPD